MHSKHFQRNSGTGSHVSNARNFHNRKKVIFSKKRIPRRDVENEEIRGLLQDYAKFDSKKAETFGDFPLSRKTQLGLKLGQYFKPTEIQSEAIGFALQENDVLGAAKTGSGKTLAFLVPILERLHLERWSNEDGLGALVITPTRELAYQIFEVLRVVGRHHDFSAGLIIGGKDLLFERARMDRCNIVICTPGRLLQHMNENPLFNADNLKVLVLDEADKILDLGFRETMDAIIDNLPPHRQTLLFSATQTKSVKDLARLSLKDPKYVSVHENAKYSTPETLSQSYVVCDVHEKMDFLWSFIRSHRKQKILVFLSSCKQVKYTYDVFCRMRPGLSVLALYGTLHQLRRMAIYDDFCKKQTAVLLATDIASRGLDFPSVNWVVHLDCPEDVNTYIHRAGRTARYEEEGQSLLVLLPSEEKAMVDQLEGHKIPLQKTHMNNIKYVSVQRKMEALCARDVKLKESAQRAFVAYLKSVFLMKDKSVFAIQSLDIDAFARSLGLAVSPRVRFLQKHLRNMEAKGLKMGPPAPRESEAKCETGLVKKPFKEAYKMESMAFGGDNSSDDEGDFLTVKRVLMPSVNTSDAEEDDLEENEERGRYKVISKASVAKKLAKKKIKVNKKIVFNDQGEEVESFPTEQKSEIAKKLLKEVDELAESGLNLDLAKQIMQEEDKVDKRLFRKRVKELHKERKRKEQAEREDEGHVRIKKSKKAESDDEDDDPDDDPQLTEFIDALPDPEHSLKDSSSKKSQKRHLQAKKKAKRLEELHADEELALQMLRTGK